MFAFIHTLLATALLCAIIALPIQIFASDSVNKEILDRNGKTPIAIYNSCGGIIKPVCDETIILDYKSDEEYGNNEFCVWVIRNEHCYGALLTKTKSGFEVGYDYLQVSGFDDNVMIGQGPNYTDIMGGIAGMEQVSHETMVSYLIFSTDDSTTGTGFRIDITGYHPVETWQYWADDFYSTSPSGNTELRNYPHRMGQSFVIAPQHLSVQSITVEIQYYTVMNDHLSVYTLERNGQTINFRPQSRRLSGRGTRSFVADYFTNFIILFSSYNTDIPVPSDAGCTITWDLTENVTTENYISSN